MYESLALYIDGEFISGGGRREHNVHNPATGEVIGRLPHETTGDLDRHEHHARSGQATRGSDWRGDALRGSLRLGRERRTSLGSDTSEISVGAAPSKTQHDAGLSAK